MFDDEFIDDQDLLSELALSEEDVRKLYDRGEITREQLFRYLDELRKSGQTKQEPSKWIKFAIIIVALGWACIFFTWAIRGCY